MRVEIEDNLYKTSQILIEVWETLNEAMTEQKIDLVELSFRTGSSELELEDYLQNYADAKVGIVVKIASALNRTISMQVGNAKPNP